jgi:hypothetical protein
MVPLTAPLFGFKKKKGVYLPQKMDLLSPLERERNSVQKHVLSYQAEISPDCFVWAAPTLRTAVPSHKYALNLSNDSQEVQELNPARVKARE